LKKFDDFPKKPFYNIASKPIPSSIKKNLGGGGSKKSHQVASRNTWGKRRVGLYLLQIKRRLGLVQDPSLLSTWFITVSGSLSLIVYMWSTESPSLGLATHYMLIWLPFDIVHETYIYLCIWWNKPVSIFNRSSFFGTEIVPFMKQWPKKLW